MKIIKRLFIILLIIISGVFYYYNYDYIFKNPAEKTELDSVVSSTLDKDGNIYIIGESGSNIIKINKKNQIVFSVNVEKNYGNARKIIVIDDSIYVHTTHTEKSGYRISGDEIVEFSTDGKFKKTIYKKKYKEPKLVSEIFGFYEVNGRFEYIVNGENGFEIRDRKNKIIREYEFDNSSNVLNSIAVSNDGSEVFYCTLYGKIYQYVDGKEDEVIFDSSKYSDFSIPRSIVMDENGKLYFTDIGLREVFYIDENGEPEIIQEYEEGTDTSGKDICYFIDANNGLVANSGYVVKLYGEEVSYVYKLTYSVKNKFICVTAWILMAMDLGIAAMILFNIVKLIKTRMTKYGKLALAAVGIVTLISVIFMGIILPPFKNLLFNQMFSQAQVLSESATNVIDKEALKNITQASDFNGDDYMKIKESMTNLFLSGNESTHGFYVQLYTIQKEDVITTTFCLQEDTGAVYPYDWEFEDSDEQSILLSQEGKTYSSISNSEGSYIFVLNPIVDDEGNSVGLIEVGTNLDNFNKEYNSLLWNLLINVAAITVVVILVLIEVLAYLEGREEYKKAKKENNGGKNVILSNGILRIIVFIIFFVTNLSTGFLPNYAMAISSDKLGIPKEILAATPISAEVVVGAIFSIWGTYVIDKLGEKRAAILSSIGIVLGFAVRLVPNIWILTLGNAIIGAGWGILLLMVNTMIALKSNEEEKDSGFAGYSAAALNGVNCGVVFGGLMTNWFSYKIIFAFSAVISFIILAYARKYFSGGILRKASEEDRDNKKGEQTVSFARFILDKRIISYFIMIVIPVIACGYFLNYMFPILGAEYGMSDTNIGYSYLLNGICVICLSNVLTKLFSTKVDKRLSLVISVLLYALAFIIVAKYQNIYSILFALILLGVSDSFGLPIQTGYYTDLDIVKKYGYDKAIGIYSLFENGAQAAGSFIFSWVLIFGVSAGLRMVTGVIIVLAFIFFVISLLGNRKNSEKLEKKEV